MFYASEFHFHKKPPFQPSVLFMLFNFSTLLIFTFLIHSYKFTLMNL